MPRVKIDDHAEWLIRLDPDGTEAHPLVEISDVLYKRHIAAMEYLEAVQKELRAIYNAEIQARQEEQMRMQKSAPTEVGPPTLKEMEDAQRRARNNEPTKFGDWVAAVPIETEEKG